ncbi:MAG: hypothetical protein AB1324_06940 [Candidatus Micrarchaeota archaeon]
MALEPARKIRKEHSSCAIFGALSFSGKTISASLAMEGIREAEEARGGSYGNGIMLAHAERGQRGKNICIWAKKDIAVDKIRRILAEEGVALGGLCRPVSGEIYTAKTEAEYLPLLAAVVRANSEISIDEGRIISFGHGMTLYKGLESLSALDAPYGLKKMEATGMIAHTRYPTGSGAKAVRAHPFAFGNVGIVHNGDVTSYAANLAACEARLAELYHRFSGNGVDRFISRLRESWVGTDSEVIAGMMYTMLKTGLESEPGLSIGGIMAALVPHFDNHLTRLLRGGDERERLNQLASNYRGFGLDGPVSSIALITYENEVQLIAFRDRNTFRPMQIVIDHSSGNVFVASELRQITAAAGIDIFSPSVESFSPEPGKFLWASSKSGIILPGRSRRPYISAPLLEGKRIHGKINGAPHQFAGNRDFSGNGQVSDEISGHRTYEGTLGSHGGSYSRGDATLEVVGSAQDNCFEASRLKKVIIHGNAGMMLGNAFQGEKFFLRGTADSRAFQQLRPHGGREPVAIIGETAGQYLGKMMSGGIIIALGLGNLGRGEIDTPIVGEFAATGAVGGKIYIRGRVSDELMGKPPQRREVISLCAQLRNEGMISDAALHEIRHDPLNIERVKELIESKKRPDSAQGQVGAAISRIEPLFERTLAVDRRDLTESDIALIGPHLEEYFRDFGMPQEWLAKALDSEFTIIEAKNAKAH